MGRTSRPGYGRAPGPAHQPSSRQSATTSNFATLWALEHDRPLYLGEFGAYDAGDMSERAGWTNFVAREAERATHGAGAIGNSTATSWRTDIAAQKWVVFPIRRALIPTSAQTGATPAHTTTRD